MSLTSLADSWGSLAWAVTWQLAALGLLAWLAERVFRLRQPRARHALWWFVLLAPLLLAPGRLVLARNQAVLNLTTPAARAGEVGSVGGRNRAKGGQENQLGGSCSLGETSSEAPQGGFTPA